MTRAKSLVIGVGNPFHLLRMEKQVVKNHGKRGNCWSTFLRSCLAHHTLKFQNLSSLEDEEECIQLLQQSLEHVNPTVNEDRIKELEAEVRTLKHQLKLQQPSPVQQYRYGRSQEQSPSHALFQSNSLSPPDPLLTGNWQINYVIII